VRLVTQELFDELPQPGEMVDIDLGSGLRARVPLVLYSRAGHTIGDDPRSCAPQPGRSSSNCFEFDVMGGVADVVVMWNVLEHFWHTGKTRRIEHGRRHSTRR